MTMTDETQIDTTFAQMRAGTVTPSEALMDRIMMDADGILAQDVLPAVQSRPTFGAMIRDVIGGWPSMGGLVAATMAGLWIGIFPPAAVTDLTQGYVGSTVEVQLFETDIYAGLDEDL